LVPRLLLTAQGGADALPRLQLAALAPQLEKLGRHKRGGGCLYLQALEDVDLKVLAKMIALTVKPMRAVDAGQRKG
jgi:hypothetical protein